MIKHRKSLRVKNYDYSSHNYYFVTICTDNHNCIFGDADNLNNFGSIADRELHKITAATQSCGFWFVSVQIVLGALCPR